MSYKSKNWREIVWRHKLLDHGASGSEMLWEVVLRASLWSETKFFFLDLSYFVSLKKSKLIVK